MFTSMPEIFQLSQYFLKLYRIMCGQPVNYSCVRLWEWDD